MKWNFTEIGLVGNEKKTKFKICKANLLIFETEKQWPYIVLRLIYQAKVSNHLNAQMHCGFDDVT